MCSSIDALGLCECFFYGCHWLLAVFFRSFFMVDGLMPMVAITGSLSTYFLMSLSGFMVGMMSSSEASCVVFERVGVWSVCVAHDGTRPTPPLFLAVVNCGLRVYSLRPNT